MNKYFRHWMLLLVYGMVTILYWGHFDNDFHFDDTHTIVDNPWIRDLSHVDSYFTKGAETFSTLPQNQMYRPLVTTTLAIDHAMSTALSDDGSGYDLLYYHLDSFFWFLLVILMLYLLAYKLAKQWLGSDIAVPAALFAALLFGIHGAMGETVNYISARSDILSTAGILGGLTLYAFKPGLRRFGIYLLPVVAGMLAKITTAMFFPVLLAWIILFESELSLAQFLRGLFRKGTEGTAARRLLYRSVPGFVVVLACALFTYGLMKVDTFYPSSFTRLEYLITQPWVIFRYFYTFIAPIGLSADSDWTILPGITDIRFLVGFAFILLLLVLIFFTSSRKHSRIISFGLSFFLFTLLPSSSLFPLAEVTNDHRIFLPYTGLILAATQFLYLAWKWIQNLAGRKLVLPAFMAIIGFWFLVHAVTLVNRNKVWQSEQTLWKDVSIKSPKNGRGLMNYGLTLMSDGDYEEALSYFNRALEFNPGYPYLFTNLAICHNALGDGIKADYYFGQALAFGPNLHEVHYFYARYLHEQERYDKAILHCRQAIELSPAYLGSRYLLLQLYYKKEQWAMVKLLAEETLVIAPGDEYAQWYIDNPGGGDAIDALRNQASVSPTKENYLNLSLALYQAGDYTGCIAACQRALEIDPYYAEAYNNICSAYNMMSMWKEAAQACEKALEINPGYELAKNNLLHAQSMAGE